MSSNLKNSLIQFQNFKKQQIIDIFDKSLQFEQQEHSIKQSAQTAALIFFEASTRTRMSFETASVRMGLHPLIFDAKSSSSLEKGETLEDTVLNIAAMKPAVLIIRAPDSLNLLELEQKVSMPILNAGWGQFGHPSQALLDAYTIFRKKGVLQNERVLIVGDVRHSRVAASHFELCKILNYEVALCGPKDFLPKNNEHKTFSKLQEGLEWATVVMALRVQKERQSENSNLEAYTTRFGLNKQSQKLISKDALIMHPGPVNYGVEMDLDVAREPRSVILEQVTNGIFIRQALLDRALCGGPR